MSIYAYTGLPGSGKSYGVIHHILTPAFKKGTPIYTNIPLKLDNIYNDFPNTDVTQLTTDDFRFEELEEPYTTKTGEVATTRGEKTWANIPPGALIVVDEIGTIYPARNKQTDYTDSFLENWTMHRHKLNDEGISQEIVIICQNLNQVSKFIRDLVDKTFNAVKMDSLGASNHFRTDIYQGSATGQKPPIRDRLSYSTAKYNKKYFTYYESHTLKSKSGVDIQGKSVGNRANVLKSPFFMFVIPTLLITMILCFYYVFNHFLSADIPEQQEEISLIDNSHKLQQVATYKVSPPADEKKFSFFDTSKNDDNVQTTIYRDYSYNGFVETSQGKRYAIIQRHHETPHLIDYHKYCKTNHHDEVFCDYLGKIYKNVV